MGDRPRPNIPPSVHVEPIFLSSRGPEPLMIHRCEVTVGTQRFLIYGYTSDSYGINRSLRSVRTHSVWRGEVVIFGMGVRVPILYRPRAKKIIMETAVAL